MCGIDKDHKLTFGPPPVPNIDGQGTEKKLTHCDHCKEDIYKVEDADPKWYWRCEKCMNDKCDWDGYCRKCVSKSYTWDKLNKKTSKHRFFRSMHLMSATDKSLDTLEKESEILEEDC